MESGAAVQDEPSGAVAFQPGTRLGKYEIGARLGVGSMGAVYEGVRTGDGKRVAIKILSAELAKRPLARARFLDEGKLTTRVRHPNIVEVIEAGEDGDTVFLVMELLDGEDLAGRLRAGAMAIDEAAELLVAVCDAVATAHGRGITHRDLKPSNIFLTVRDGRRQPIVLDFGIAREEDGAAAKASETRGPGPLMVFGTPYYLSPEQVADHRAAGPASDQYALGVILYECLTGERPYRGDDMNQLFTAIVAGAAPPPRTRREEISAELEAVVLRAMSPTPGRRFASVADFGKALQPFASAPVEGAPPRRRRPPSSPAIEAEAATPSLFIRTLIPDLQAESDPWFAAPRPTEDVSEELTVPTPSRTRAADAPGLKSSPHQAAVEEAWTDRPPKSRRMLPLAVGAAAALVVSLILVLTRAGSDQRPVAPAVSTVQALPSARPTQPSPRALASAKREESPTSKVANVQPTRAAAPPAPTAEGATAPVTKNPSPSAAATPPPNVARKPVPPAPRPVNAATAAMRRERSVAAPATDGVPRERPAPPRPRETGSTDIKTHNGVPLLD